MGEKLRAIGGFALGTAVLVALITIPIILFLGIAWAAKNLLQPLMVVGWIAFAIDLLILLPLSVFRRLREFTGTAIFVSSFIFGLATWLLSFVLTWVLWGGWAVVIGVLFLGGTVVPFALLASLFQGQWDSFFSVLVLFVLTFGTRFLGLALAASGSK